MTLQFLVNNQSLTLNPAQQGVRIASDSKNYLKARFTFQTSEWTRGTVRYALFSHNGKTFKKFLGIEPGCKSNECFVSPEVIKEGSFTVSIFCDDVITSTKVTIPVEDSGYTEDIENQVATPSVQEQYNEMLYKYAALCVQLHEECEKIKKELEVTYGK